MDGTLVDATASVVAVGGARARAHHDHGPQELPGEAWLPDLSAVSVRVDQDGPDVTVPAR